jgi:hypothetical protein
MDGIGAKRYTNAHTEKLIRCPTLAVGGMYLSMVMSLRPRICEGVQGWIKRDGMLLAIACEVHLTKSDTSHLRIASLEHRLLVVGFEVPANLIWFVRAALVQCR